MAHEGERSAAVGYLTTAPNGANATEIEGSTLRSAPVGEQPVHDRFPEVHSHAYCFLEKVKNRFGTNSRQSVSIHNKLGEFLASETSKRDTYFTILDELENNEDLKGEFQAILNHEDAQWRPTDFQPESSGVDTHVSPDFLQPDHRPSLPMPTVSTFWNTGHYNRPLQPTQPAINPELLHGQVEVPYPTNREYRSHGYYMTPDVLGNSSVTQNTDQPGFFNGETTPYSKSFASSMPSAATHSYCHFNEPHSHNFSTNGYTQPFPNSASIKDGLDQEPELSSPVRQAAGHPHYSFSLNEAWNRAQYDNSAACAQNGENYYNGPTASSFEGERHEPLLQFVSPEKSSSIPTPSLIGTPNMGPSPRTTLNTSPLEQSFRGESLVSELEGEKYDKEHEFIYLKDSATEPKPDLLPEAPVLAHAGPVTGPVKPSGRPTRVKGEFIHSLCGKSFATRHGVKKHHWGPKIDDRATTTGCWAKHGKPGVEWDDHPSCTDDHSTSRVSRNRPSQTPHTPFGIPVAPSVIASHGSQLPAIPTLENLPNIVAESLHSTPSSPYFPFHGEVIPFHTAQVPVHKNHGSHGSLETLLKVVNVASTLDSPTPGGRNDSVASPLDTKIASTEIRGRHTPSWLETPWTHGYSGNDQVPYHNPHDRAPGLGIAEVGHHPAEGSKGLSYLQGQLQKVVAEPNPGTKMGEDRNMSISEGQNGLVGKHTDRNVLMQDDRKRLRGPHSSISKNELKGLGLDASPEPKTKRQKSVGGQKETLEET